MPQVACCAAATWLLRSALEQQGSPRSCWLLMNDAVETCVEIKCRGASARRRGGVDSSLLDGASTAASPSRCTRHWLISTQVETFVKWIPKPLPTPTTRSDTQKLVRELSRSCSLGSELSLSGRKPGRFRAAARRVIAEKRLSTVDSDPSGSRKED